MLNKFIQKNRPLILIVLLPSLTGSMLVMIRIYETGTLTYAYLIWNLFLAWIPLVLSLIAELLYLIKHRFDWYTVVISLLWLLFYPNAPYIITDLLHLPSSGFMPPWFDLALLLSFVWAGLFIGFVSLFIMHTVVKSALNKLWGWVFVTITLGLSSFGIYLGRFLRWNSWDVITNPKDLLYESLAPFLSPMEYRISIYFTGIFFIISVYIYLTFYFTATACRREVLPKLR